jgi:cytoskeletal protein RodZ
MELRSIEAAHVDAQSEEWFASYAEPSNQPSNQRRRVHQRRSRDSSRDSRRQRHRLNTLMMMASVVFVGAMTACFYAILTR